VSGPQSEDIMKLDRTGLIKLWLEMFKQPVPRSISMQLMRRLITFEAQIKEQGSLPLSTRRRLDALSKPNARLEPEVVCEGTRLIREWNGVTHIVEVTTDGYRWKGQTHKSLSAIARMITGARWSGPRFFGTNRGTSNAKT
jgi:hypothetical protein